jgi:hypothetical protein
VTSAPFGEHQLHVEDHAGHRGPGVLAVVGATAATSAGEYVTIPYIFA